MPTGFPWFATSRFGREEFLKRPSELMAVFELAMEAQKIGRMNPEHAAAARQAARDSAKQVGQWLEEAITEKQEREKGEEDVTKADC